MRLSPKITEDLLVGRDHPCHPYLPEWKTVSEYELNYKDHIGHYIYNSQWVDQFTRDNGHKSLYFTKMGSECIVRRGGVNN